MTTNILCQLVTRTKDIRDMFEVIQDQLTDHAIHIVQENEEERQRQEQDENKHRQQAHAAQEVRSLVNVHIS